MSTILFNANAVIKDAFLDLGVFQPGQTPLAPDAQFALDALNQLVNGLQNQPLTIPFIKREVFSVVSGQSTYTMGPGGNFNTDRPSSLTGAGLLLPSTGATIGKNEISIAPLTDDAYRAIHLKDLQSSMWTDYYFNPTYSGGLASVFLWPTPNSPVYTLALYWGQSLAEFADLTTTYSLPNGVRSVFRYSLAELLSPSYGKEWTVVLERLKNKAMANFKRQNFKLTDSPVDQAMTRDRRGGYNIETGTGG